MNTEKQYIQAFNSGYILEKYKPRLLKNILQNITPTNNYLLGLFAGKNHLELENTKDQLLELHQLRKQSQSLEKGLEK